MKLWLRIAAPTMGLLAAAVVVPSALLIREHEREEPLRMRRNAAALSASTAIAAARPLAEGDTGELTFLVVNLVHRNRDLAYACVVDRERRVVAHSDPDVDEGALADPTSVRALAASRTLFQEVRGGRGGEAGVLEVAEPVTLSGARLGTLRIGFSLADHERRLRGFYVRTLASGGLFLGLGLATSLVLARAVARSREELDRRNRDLERLVAEKSAALEGLRAAQDAMVRSARLAVAGELVAGVAHEMNNPLASIAGAAEGLLRRAAQGSLDKDLDGAREYLEIIRDEAFRARAITRDLLDFVRKETAKAAPVQANDLVRSVASLLKLRPRERPFEVALELADDAALPPVLGNVSKLRQVVFNVTDNAVDALPERDGRIVWSTRAEDREGRTDVVLRCSDNGSGIARDQIARIFEPFFTTKEPGRGTGLGLAICYGIVESHGGTIEVESPGPGGGTVVTIRLPAVAARADAADPDRGVANVETERGSMPPPLS